MPLPSSLDEAVALRSENAQLQAHLAEVLTRLDAALDQRDALQRTLHDTEYQLNVARRLLDELRRAGAHESREMLGVSSKPR